MINEKKFVIVEYIQSCAPFATGEKSKVTEDHASVLIAQGFAKLHGDGIPKPRNKDGDWIRTNGPRHGQTSAPQSNESIIAENKLLKEQLDSLLARVDSIEGKGKAKPSSVAKD